VSGSLLYLTDLACILRGARARPRPSLSRRAHVGLYTILLLPILYGVWHTNGRSKGGGRILPNSRAIVLHQCAEWRWARGVKGWLIRAQTLRSERISCEGQGAAHVA